MITLVLAWGTSDDTKTTLNYNLDWWDYSNQEVINMLSRYNGTKSEAAQYGKEAYNCYELFKKYK